MKFGEIPESTGSGLKLNPGINELHLTNWEITTSTYGKQLLVEFSPNPEADKPKLFKQWISFKGVFNPDMAWTFKAKIQQWKDLLYVAGSEQSNTDYFNNLMAIADDMEFDPQDRDSIQRIEEYVVSNVMKTVAASSKNPLMKVILHWGGQYLNIPTYKENGYNLPFGANPIQGDHLAMEKPPVPEYVPTTENEDSNSVAEEPMGISTLQ